MKYKEIMKYFTGDPCLLAYEWLENKESMQDAYKDCEDLLWLEWAFCDIDSDRVESNIYALFDDPQLTSFYGMTPVHRPVLAYMFRVLRSIPKEFALSLLHKHFPWELVEQELLFTKEKDSNG